MITVIVPVYNQIKITEEFFKTISENTILPEKIILIDNGSSDNYFELVNKFKNLNISYIKNEINEGVNAAWNYGISIAKTPYISILNNDLLLNKYFFKMIIQAMFIDKKLGIIVPTTILKDKEYRHKTKDELPILGNLVKREGWAFTIRKDITDNINPIPLGLKTYFGDDYLFHHTKRLNYKTMKIINNFIFHYVGKTIKTVISNPDARIKQERPFWNDSQKD
jgi:GT2 family glycosyltransferase